jgi:hypothetical protein
VSAVPAPDFDHLLHLTDDRGTFEHALLTEPRVEGGYCTDDMARVLVVACREPRPLPSVRRLGEVALRFLGDAQGLDGDFRNRMDHRGRWQDRRSVEDCWGRSMWALGTAASQSPADWMRQTAVALFERGAHKRSPWPRATAYAALGAAELLVSRPDHRGARSLLVDAAAGMPHAAGAAAWPWPEARLTYANAALPEAMIATGAALRRPSLVAQGLEVLGWLLEHETLDGHLSVTPVGGAGPDDARPRFDQQPIEVAALADACARAAAVDGDRRWADGVSACVAWFLGDNDSHEVMLDPTTGGGFDGLEPEGVNRNQGAESTLAVLATLQHARHLVPA